MHSKYPTILGSRGAGMGHEAFLHVRWRIPEPMYRCTWNLDIPKTRLCGRDLLDRSCTQVKYPGYSETNRYNESEENAGPNKLNHILAICGTSSVHQTTK